MVVSGNNKVCLSLYSSRQVFVVLGVILDRLDPCFARDNETDPGGSSYELINFPWRAVRGLCG